MVKRIVRFGVVGLLILAGLSSCKGCKKEKEDKGPVIEAEPLQTRVGEEPDYRKDVVAKVDSQVVPVEVDSDVRIDRPGEYPVRYTAKAPDGTETTEETTVRVCDPHDRIVYLTFDDGPSENTLKILDILREKGVKATFFVVGHNKNYLHCIRRAEQEGHAIAAHTYTHDFSKVYRSVDDYFADLERIEEVIEQQTGHRTNIIRFPGGSSNTVNRRFHKGDPGFMDRLKAEVLRRGYQYVDWNVCSDDATAATVPVARILKSACKDKYAEACVLMHDTRAKTTTVQALPAIIDYYRSKGYSFGTITSPSYVCHHGGFLGYRVKSSPKKNETQSEPDTALPAMPDSTVD